MKKINLKKYKETLEAKISPIKERLESNYLHAYSWGAADDLFFLTFQISILEQFGEEENEEVLKNNLQKLLFIRLPLRTSSSSSSNAAAVLEINAINDLMHNLGWYAV